MVVYSFYHSADLPWTIFEEDKRRFRKILRRVFILCLLFAIAVPFLPVSEIEREKAETVPPRLAKLVLERKKAKPPAPAKAPEIKTAKKKPKAKKAKPKKKDKPKVKKKTETARERAQRAGLLAFKDELAALRNNPALANIKKNSPLTGSAKRSAERFVITAGASQGSGGINTAKLSRDTGGVALAGRKTASVSSPVSSVGSKSAGAVPRSGGGRKASRSIEAIQLVFDRNKGAIYSIYNRALRQDPTLEGKVVLRIKITPAGKVIACEVVSSELGSPALERKLVARIRLFDFGAKDVETMVVTYPIDFLPS
ncbi:MAG: TonB family protein [Acidiferrobacterales bacterium]